MYPSPVTLILVPSIHISLTVISFLVIVPVLSVQIIVELPRVSTEDNLLIIEFLFTILLTPRASVIVTTAGNPSGTAETANPITVNIISFISIIFPIALYSMISVTATIVQRISTIIPSCLPNLLSFF